MLRWHAFGTFLPSDSDKIRQAFNESTAEEDPQVFQAFVWRSKEDATNGLQSAEDNSVSTEGGDSVSLDNNPISKAPKVRFRITMEAISSDNEWMSPSPNYTMNEQKIVLTNSQIPSSASSFRSDNSFAALAADDDDDDDIEEKPLLELFNSVAKVPKIQEARGRVCLFCHSDKLGSHSGCTCNKCKWHCTCGAKVQAQQIPKVTRKVWPNREEVDEQIYASVMDRMPAKMKDSCEGGKAKWSDFTSLVPCRPELINHLHDMFRISCASALSKWHKIKSYAIDVVLDLGAAVAHRNEVKEVQDRLLEEIHTRTSSKQKATRLEKKKEKHLINEIEYAHNHPARNDEHSKMLRAYLTNGFSPGELDAIQEEAGIPKSNRLKYGKEARKQGRLDYKKLTGKEDDIDSYDKAETLLLDEEMVKISEELDGVISHVVSFILKHCQIISWGLKTVPAGDGETTTIPNLTRMCTVEEMWEKYSSERESAKLPFKCIVTYEGPLWTNSERYKGSSYNVLVEWGDDGSDDVRNGVGGDTSDNMSDGTRNETSECEASHNESNDNESKFSFEPLSVMALDDPVSCALFGEENGLLDKLGWTRLKHYVSSDGKGMKKRTFRAFKGGRKMVGRSTFFEIVRVLTGGGEKLVCSVDYVKGNLVHAVVEVLQRIIDDHFKSNIVTHKKLSRELKLLCNFLKNLFKSHIGKEEDCVDWITHSIEHGLGIPDVIDRPKHYSMMSLDELNEELEHRCIDKPKDTSLKPRILLLMEDDFAKELMPDESERDGRSNAGTDAGTDCRGRWTESTSASDMIDDPTKLLECIDNMELNEL
jgi:hypothetical protein